MRFVIAAVAAWLAATVNVSALPYLKVMGVTPDFVLVLAACWAVLRPQEETMITVPIAGLFHDVAFGDPVGTSVLALAPLVALASVIRIRAVETQFLPMLILVATGTVVYGLIRMTVLFATGQEVQWVAATLHVVLPLAVVNALFSPLVYVPASWFNAGQRQGIMGGRRITSAL